MKLHDFGDFFASVNNGHEPFQWQRRLCEFVAFEGRWPEIIAAPTGSGKSNVVDVHVFLNALHAVEGGPRVPRRMSVVVGRRGLVDQHLERASAIQTALRDADDGLLREVRDALASLVARDDVHSPGRDRAGEPLVVVSLRGGVSPNTEWIADPRACGIIAATPDMWGSRLLFRGYGASRPARPREAGLLARDSVMILDEAHLNRQLLATARTVAAEGQRWDSALGVPGLQVVATSATQESQPLATVGVEERDLTGADPVLATRLTRPKPVNVHRSGQWPKAKATDAYVKELCDLAEAEYARRPAGEGTVGVIVNHVHTAIKVTAVLTQRLKKYDEPGVVVPWVGRMRPLDLQRHRADHPELFMTCGDPGVAFLVATQTVEVGVDIDLAALVTELAPGSALAQRAGRVNRLGLREEGPITVVVPEGGILDRPPYTAADLRAAETWLSHISQDPKGLSAWSLVTDPPPPQSLGRLVISELQPADWALLAETSSPHFAEPDLEFWLRDYLEQESDPVGVVLRDTLPEDDVSALELLRVTSLDDSEIYPTTLQIANGVITRVLWADERARAFLIRGDEQRLLEPDDRIRPGDTLVLDAVHPIAWHGAVLDEPTPDPAPAQCLWSSPEKADVASGAVILADDEGPTSRRVRHRIDGLDSEDACTAASEELGVPVDVVVFPEPDSGEPMQWIVLRPASRIVEDPELRQESTNPAAGVAAGVALKQHSSNVGRLAQRMAAELGLATDLVHRMEAAGLHHDDGKTDPRFQVVLGGSPDSPLAKSSAMSSQARWTARRRSGLPPAWRHEQLSAVLTSNVTNDPLVIRLVGTSHGRGRPHFPHGRGLLPVADDAVEAFFGNGTGWSDLLEATEAEYGVWGCAYLEAILRSADCLVSKDGS